MISVVVFDAIALLESSEWRGCEELKLGTVGYPVHISAMLSIN